MTALFASFGALAGAGLALLLSAVGVLRWNLPGGLLARAPTDPARRHRSRRRAALSLVAGLIALVLTRWPVAFAMAAMAVLGADALAGRPMRGIVACLEALADWTEMLRDTLAGAAGLTQAIAATAPVAPAAIRREVAELSSRTAAGVGFMSSLASFGEALSDPAADMVVAALAMAATERSQRLGDLLGVLAGAIRDEITMRLEVEASRASARTAVRAVSGFSVGFLLFMAVVARTYLVPYGTTTGQFVLALVACIFAAGLWLMAAMTRPKAVGRIRLEAVAR